MIKLNTYTDFHSIFVYDVTYKECAKVCAEYSDECSLYGIVIDRLNPRGHDIKYSVIRELFTHMFLHKHHITDDIMERYGVEIKATSLFEEHFANIFNYTCLNNHPPLGDNTFRLSVKFKMTANNASQFSDFINTMKLKGTHIKEITNYADITDLVKRDVNGQVI